MTESSWAFLELWSITFSSYISSICFELQSRSQLQTCNKTYVEESAQKVVANKLCKRVLHKNCVRKCNEDDVILMISWVTEMIGSLGGRLGAKQRLTNQLNECHKGRFHGLRHCGVKIEQEVLHLVRRSNFQGFRIVAASAQAERLSEETAIPKRKIYDVVALGNLCVDIAVQLEEVRTCMSTSYRF